ncbi:hypothetical protein HDE_11068 [Halotydeus destructor]|nr:hypothetical protein HDE_11068 [Halotydeus destructor]
MAIAYISHSANTYLALFGLRLGPVCPKWRLMNLVMRVCWLGSSLGICDFVITTHVHHGMSEWSGLTAFGLRCAAILVVHAVLWTKLDFIGHTLEEYYLAMTDSNRKKIVKMSKLGLIAIAFMTFTLCILILFRIKLYHEGSVKFSIDELSWNVDIKLTLLQLLLVLTIGTYLYAAIFIYAMSQLSLLLLNKQSLQIAMSKPRESISAIKEVRKIHKQLLTFYNMAADHLSIVPDTLTGLIFFNLALYAHDFMNKSETSIHHMNTWFLVIDMLFLLTTLMAMATLAIMVKGNYGAFRNALLKLAQPNVDDGHRDLALSKISLLADLSANQLQATPVLGLLDFDRSFPIKFLGSLLPFTSMVLTPIMLNVPKPS